MYHELKFDEKEQYNTEKENEEYLKELEKRTKNGTQGGKRFKKIYGLS